MNRFAKQAVSLLEAMGYSGTGSELSRRVRLVAVHQVIFW